MNFELTAEEHGLLRHWAECAYWRHQVLKLGYYRRVSDGKKVRLRRVSNCGIVETVLPTYHNPHREVRG